ncbi:hypothetical protein KKJ04_24665, partial [Xenorhabdus bovienii]
VCVVLYFTRIKETRRERVELLCLYIYTSEGEEGEEEEDGNGKEFTIDGERGGETRRKEEETHTHTDEGVNYK